MLTALGLGQQIARNVSQYVDIAVSLAGATPTQADTRPALHRRLQASSLLDGPAFAAAMEATYGRMLAASL